MSLVRKSLNVLKYCVLILIVLIVCGWLFIAFAPDFGGIPDEGSQSTILTSPNYNGEHFLNLVPTTINTRDQQSSPGMIRSILGFLRPPKGKNPSVPLPSIRFDYDQLDEGSFVWMGHSTILFKLDGLTILTDPVFHRASPVPGTVKPFDYTNPIGVGDLPPHIDVVIISHDHYDHLDYRTIKYLIGRADRFLVPLGVKAHLAKWGIADAKIIEKDWYESDNHQSLTITATPARHFSGRGLNNFSSTLWASWVVQSTTHSVFFNGDSGYFDEFSRIGAQYGPFDIAFVENGAYESDWAQIHMFPEESVQASIDLQAKVMFPIHWGKFDLSTHDWDEPIIRTHKESQLRGVKVATPLVGEIFTLDAVPNTTWWEVARNKEPPK